MMRFDAVSFTTKPRTIAGMVGLAFSVTALLRREGYKVLPILGTIINVSFFLWLQSRH